jgi:hypothetical protein
VDAIGVAATTTLTGVTASALGRPGALQDHPMPEPVTANGTWIVKYRIRNTAFG